MSVIYGCKLGVKCDDNVYYSRLIDAYLFNFYSRLEIEKTLYRQEIAKYFSIETNISTDNFNIQKN